MGRIRARFVFLTFVAASLSVFASHRTHGQSPSPSPLSIVVNLGLPGVDQGNSFDLSHTPGSVQAASRATLRDSIQRERAGGDADYVPGRVIVKFRDQSSTDERTGAVRHALDSPAAFIAE